MRRMNLNFRVAGSEPFFGGLPHTANTELNTNTADGFLLPTMLRVLTALAENTIDAGFAASFPPWPDGTQHEKSTEHYQLTLAAEARGTSVLLPALVMCCRRHWGSVLGAR